MFGVGWLVSLCVVKVVSCSTVSSTVAGCCCKCIANERFGADSCAVVFLYIASHVFYVRACVFIESVACILSDRGFRRETRVTVSLKDGEKHMPHSEPLACHVFGAFYTDHRMHLSRK